MVENPFDEHTRMWSDEFTSAEFITTPEWTKRVRERLVQQAEDDLDFYDMERDAFIAGGNFVLDALTKERSKRGLNR